jgi:hypothetical protein
VKNLVAKMTVVGVRPDGSRVTLTVEIGRPHEERNAWACPIAVAPLHGKLADIRGTDSFHAVWLACVLALKLLTNLKSDGWRLEYEDGSAFPLEAYLLGFGGQPLQ